MDPTRSSTSRTPPGRDATGLGAPHRALIADVEAAVRSVLATQGGGSNGMRRTAEDEVFAERLFAVRHAEGLSAVVHTVRIAPGTVVTPLARDLLKRRGIAIFVVSNREVARVKSPGEWGFAIQDTAESGTIAALRRFLLEGGWGDLNASLLEGARWVADAPDRGALYVTHEASRAVWRACQVVGVRAACAADPDGVARAVRHLGMNLLVVEPSGKSISWMRQLGLTFRRAGAPALP